MGLPDAFFVTTQVHEREVELGDGSKHTVYFRELPANGFRSFQIAEMSNDPAVKADSMSRLIAATVCDPDGELCVPLDRAKMLKPRVMNALVAKILEINEIGADAAKKLSPPEVPTGSGT
jgi:hypothetical protein